MTDRTVITLTIHKNWSTITVSSQILKHLNEIADVATVVLSSKWQHFLGPQANVSLYLIQNDNTKDAIVEMRGAAACAHTHTHDTPYPYPISPCISKVRFTKISDNGNKVLNSHCKRNQNRDMGFWQQAL